MFAEVLEHIGAVGVDFFCRWSLPVFGEHAAPRFEGSTRRLAFERGREITFKDFANITGGRNAMRVSLTFRAASSFSGSSIIMADSFFHHQL